MIKKRPTALYSNNNIFYFNEDSGDVVLSCNELVFLIPLMMTLKQLFKSIFWANILNLKNAKHLKKLDEELMLIAWHPRRWWNFCMLEDEKKETEWIFTESCFDTHQ